jgi:predicted porin
MTFKKTALLLAMAGIVAAPMAAQAESGFYGSARVGLNNYTDDANADAMTIMSHASRFGFAGEADMGNGSTGYGKYEMGYGSGGATQRHLYAGIKNSMGDFRVIDQGYTTFYNHVEAAVDIPWWNGVSSLAGNSRNTNAFNYEGGSGAVKFGVAIEADGSEDGPSGTEFGLSFDAGPVAIGLGVKDAEVYDDAITGLTVSGSAGDIGYGLSLQNQGDADSTVVSLTMGDIYFSMSMGDDGAGTEPSITSVGYTHSIGRQTSAWFEYASADTDGGNDWSELHAVLKFDWK